MMASEFEYLAQLLKKRSGLMLTEDKTYLIEGRLLPIARVLGLQDISQLCTHLRSKGNEELLVEITEAMTTNESSFFRDIKPFEYLRQVLLPQLQKKQAASRQIRIWSAACSTGQEPYSVALCLKEDSAPLLGWKVELVATDLARKVIDRAQQGIYSQFEAQRGLSIQMLVKYFSAMSDTSWQLKEEIRSMVQFKQQNLLEEYGSLGKFDVIFCRNVLIYFDEETRSSVTEKMAHALQPHGVLILGATETLIDPHHRFVAVEECRGAYRLKGTAET